MQTVASLAKRLDMTAEEAVATLCKLGFDVEGVETDIDDDQCDLLIDVDEDPSALDAYLQERKKEEEARRKKAERLQKAAKKAAAKKAAAKKKKAAAEVVVEETEAKESEEAEVAPPEEAPEVIVVETEPPAPESTPAETEKEAPEVAPVVEEAPVVEAKPEIVPEEQSEPVESAPPAETSVPEVAAEAAPAEQEVPATPPATAPDEPAAVEEAPVAEILPPADPDSPTADSDKPRRGADAPAHESTLAKAEILHDKEEEEREAKPAKPAKPARPLPTPDPDVVAAVIRRDREKRLGITRTGGAPGGPRNRGAAGGPGGGRDNANAPARPGRAAPPSIEEEGRREQQFRNAPRKPSAAGGKAVRKKPKRAERARVIESHLRRDAAAAVREFQSGAGGAGSKKRKKKRQMDAEPVVVEKVGGTIEVDETMTVEQVADAMSVPVNDLILDLMDDNMMVTKNQSLDIDVIRKLASKRDYEVQSIIPEEDDVLTEEPDDPADLQFRAPVVTIMGHVDHGKTSLLDVVRKANVVDGEAGGITQHIAAYDVELAGGRIVFLDTPGHEAFTQMRSRGASVTDVVVLVVAADDGVKPQTIEAIDHAKAAEVPIVVAINKCDKPEAQPDKVRAELANYGLQDDQWGGDVTMKNVSAHSGEGINELMELLVLESEMLELKANPDKKGRGAIVEAELSLGHGPVAWVLVQSGTLRVGDIFLSGETYGRVRTMTNSKGRQVKEADPSTPVLVTGFSSVPEAGDQFFVLEEERIARSIADKRAAHKRQKRGASSSKHMTLEDFHALMEGVEQKTLNIIIKADAQGSADVLVSSFAKLGNEEVSINVVHSGVGGVNESDVLLAGASDAVIIGFHVTANAKVKAMAEEEGVDIRTYLIIYEAIDEVQRALEGMLTPDKKEVIVGHAEIRQVFRSSKVGNIAGSIQLDGETVRGAMARLIRDDVVIYTGKIATVRREKDEVKSVSQGFECGLKLERFDDIQVGDIIETYRVESVAKKLA